MPDFFPVWGERSADIAPQVYNWAQTNYRNQEANIGRLGDYDRQAIANQQNYFQARQAMEREDANRQLAAQELSRREAADQGRLDQGAYQFQATLKDSAARQAEEKRWHDLQYGPAAQAEAKTRDQAQADQAIKLGFATGKYSPLEPELAADALGIPREKASALAAPFVEPFKAAKLDAINLELNKLRAKLKPGQSPDLETFDRLRDNLPAKLRDQVFLDNDALRFKWLSSLPKGLEGEDWGFASKVPATAAPGPSWRAGLLDAAKDFAVSPGRAALRWLTSSQPGGAEARPATPPSGAGSYSSESEARAAGHRDGDVIIVGGRRAMLTPD